MICFCDSILQLIFMTSFCDLLLQLHLSNQTFTTTFSSQFLVTTFHDYLFAAPSLGKSAFSVTTKPVTAHFFYDSHICDHELLATHTSVTHIHM